MSSLDIIKVLIFLLGVLWTSMKSFGSHKLPSVKAWKNNNDQGCKTHSRNKRDIIYCVQQSGKLEKGWELQYF